ncbi:MAG: hypothetical protein L3J62_01405 [Gammaproteobacteria bacterium]|nr:hypothetical protein [Gammaproteobacteria bacterium]MCF6229442.1 hypothetical protein [Gammaproteobacteria bacterium]
MPVSEHNNIDDKMLIAFLDNELSNEQMTWVEQAINEDGALAARAESLALADDLASQAYQHAMHEPTPQRLIDAVWKKGAEQPRTNVVNLASRRRFSGLLPLATAASLALVVGAILGPQLTSDDIGTHQLAQTGQSNPSSQSALYIALEKTPSLQHFEVENGHTILPVMSFQAVDGRYCREFQVNKESSVSVGVACKQDGTWNTEILLAADHHPVDHQNYQPASGYSQITLDAVLDDLWSGIAFDQTEEQALIQKAWR